MAVNRRLSEWSLGSLQPVPDVSVTQYQNLNKYTLCTRRHSVFE